jgi:hypothetical protein
MDKTSNFALNSTRMQQAHYFRHTLHAEKNYWSAGRGDIAPCPPPKYATAATILNEIKVKTRY